MLSSFSQDKWFAVFRRVAQASINTLFSSGSITEKPFVSCSWCNRRRWCESHQNASSPFIVICPCNAWESTFTDQTSHAFQGYVWSTQTITQETISFILASTAGHGLESQLNHLICGVCSRNTGLRRAYLKNTPPWVLSIRNKVCTPRTAYLYDLS